MAAEPDGPARSYRTDARTGRGSFRPRPGAYDVHPWGIDIGPDRSAASITFGSSLRVFWGKLARIATLVGLLEQAAGERIAERRQCAATKLIGGRGPVQHLCADTMGRRLS